MHTHACLVCITNVAFLTGWQHAWATTLQAFGLHTMPCKARHGGAATAAAWHAVAFLWHVFVLVLGSLACFLRGMVHGIRGINTPPPPILHIMACSWLACCCSLLHSGRAALGEGRRIGMLCCVSAKAWHDMHLSKQSQEGKGTFGSHALLHCVCCVEPSDGVPRFPAFSYLDMHACACKTSSDRDVCFCLPIAMHKPCTLCTASTFH